MKMKRMLILMVMLVTLCMSSVVHAESNEAAQVLLGQYKDMKLNCEAGINYYDYSKLYRELYVATMKQQGNIDKVTFDKFITPLRYYEYAPTDWNKLYDSKSVYNGDVRQWFRMASEKIDEIDKTLNAQQ